MRKTYTKFFRKLLANLLSIALLFNLISVSSVAASIMETESSPVFIRGTLSDFSVTQTGTDLTFSGLMASHEFSITGTIYSLYDNINSNKIYVVENTTDPEATVEIINLEFERNAKKENLEVSNRHLIGKDVLRLAATIEGQIYYVEQAFEITDLILNNIQYESEKAGFPELQTIISNSTWYTNLPVQDRDLSPINPGSLMPTSTTVSAPSLSADLDANERAAITRIGASEFTKEQDKYAWGQNLPYLYYIHCVEWPADSGTIHISFVYYDVVTNAPKTSGEASCQISLTLDRQYRWLGEDNNVIEPYFMGTNCGIKDVQLTMACAQKNAGNGYDYIYERTVSATGGNNSAIPFALAKSFALYFDKYGILAAGFDILEAYNSSKSNSGMTDDGIPVEGVETGTTIYHVWSQDYDEHYAQINTHKPAYSMLRAVGATTSGRVLEDEGDHIMMRVSVADRDYEDSATNISMEKAMNYTLSCNIVNNNSSIQTNFSHTYTKTYTR